MKIKWMLFSLAINLVMLCTTAYPQMIDNAALFRTTGYAKSVRLHYENDYFSASDLYYTQGINLEVIHPAIKKIFPSFLLNDKPGKQSQYGIAAEHLGFTPTTISSSQIPHGDRPFASCLMLKFFSIRNDSVRNFRFVSTVIVGVIGPSAGGKEFQSAVHRWIGDMQPKGWEHQIRNDVVIGYQADFTKGIVDYRYFTMAGKGSVRVGTLNAKASGGMILMAGLFDNPWTFFQRSKPRFRINIYCEPLLNLTGYDATLQGGLFNRNSAYTIRSSDLTRFVFQNNAGVIIRMKKVNLEYFQSFITKEFDAGGSHHWGGVRIGIGL
jgi:lipid A 3-O-deacylase